MPKPHTLAAALFLVFAVVTFIYVANRNVVVSYGAGTSTAADTAPAVIAPAKPLTITDKAVAALHADEQAAQQVVVTGQTVKVVYNVAGESDGQALTRNAYRSFGSMADTLFTALPDITMVRVVALTDFVTPDKFGNDVTSTEPAITLGMNRATWSKINWTNLLVDRCWSVQDLIQEHQTHPVIWRGIVTGGSTGCWKSMP